MADEEFIADPTDHVIAILDGGSDIESVQQALQDAGLDGVRVYQGRSGAESIDSTGSEHGVGGSLIRGLQQALTNKDNLAEYEEAARQGATVVAVRVSDEEAQDRAASILEAHGARTINHYGEAIVREIKP